MILKSHLLSMILYALFVSVVLAFIRRENKKERFKYGLSLFFIMTAGALLLGWFMLLFAK